MHRTEPTILHADLDAFYASVEQRDDPALRNRPVIVDGGVVLAASYEAKACGVRTAMNGARARRLCPEAVVVSPRFSAYSAASKVVFEIFRRSSPLVEPLSIDEAFIDARGLQHIGGTPVQIATRLRAEVREIAGLPLTVGIASTKFLAKVASGVAKPDGLLLVPAGGELAFLHPLPVTALWGVGRVSAAKLHDAGITTVAQVAALGEPRIVELLGRGTGRHVYALAIGRDPRVVRPGIRRRSVGAQRALGRRGRDPTEVRIALAALVDRAARRMRAGGRACRTVVLRLRFADYERATRSRTLAEATTRTAVLLTVARRLLAGAADLVARRGLTLIGVTLTNLCDARAIQLALPFDRARGLDAALDAVHDRFGTAAVRRAVHVGRPPDEGVPLQPE
ncbi:MAG TPA: DNA polymerase IV [Solirubrobacteraceae bacterium]|nr:DNA polymerase IV [Solirubrobacteraceae bacterium]